MKHSFQKGALKSHSCAFQCAYQHAAWPTNTEITRDLKGCDIQATLLRSVLLHTNGNYASVGAAALAPYLTVVLHYAFHVPKTWLLTTVFQQAIIVLKPQESPRTHTTHLNVSLH